MSATGGLRRAVVWSAVENGGVALLSLITLIVFARYLKPSDFGLFSMALAIVEVGTLLTATFFQDALIQRDKVDKSHYESAFWVSFGASIGFVVLCGLFADTFSEFAQSPSAGLVLVLTALAVPATTLSATVVAKLKRELNLRPLALRTLTGRAASAAAGIALAVTGWGIWAMVAQQVLLPVLGALMLWFMVKPRYRLRVSSERLSEIASFGLSATVAQFLSYSVKRVFVVLAGFYLGPEAAGQLNLAFRVVEMMWSLCNTAVVQVVLPLFSRKQSDSQATQSVFAQVSEMTCLVVFPLFGAIALLAPDILGLLFGSRWVIAAPYVTVMALVVLLQLPRLLMASQLSAAGTPGSNAAAGAVEFGLVLSMFALLRPDSAVVALGIWVVREIVGCAITSWMLHRQGVVLVRAQWLPALPFLFGALVLLAGGAWARFALMPFGLSHVALLALLAPLAAALYFGAVACVDRQVFVRLKRFWTNRSQAQPSA